MKKQILAMAIASVIAAPVLADATVYGKALVTLDHFDENGVKDWRLNSNNSRVGIKGKEELSDTLSAIYSFEYQTDVAEGTNGRNQTFRQRNIYVGLKGDFGTAKVGRFDTPLKASQKKIDLFNDLSGDLTNTFAGEQRQSNALQYTTPDISGLSASLMISPGEEPGTDRDSVADTTSISVNYNWEKLYLALAVDRDMDSAKLADDGISGLVDIVRVVGQYTIADLQLGALYQTEEASDDSSLKGKGYFVSAAYQLDAVVLKAQYGNNEADDNSLEYETVSVGADYKFSKRTKVLAYYTKNQEKVASDDTKVFGVGIEHKF